MSVVPLGRCLAIQSPLLERALYFVLPFAAILPLGMRGSSLSRLISQIYQRTSILVTSSLPSQLLSYPNAM
jgi:hypothetical protein